MNVHRHMPRSSTGQQSFVKAEAALKLSPGRDVRLKLCEENWRAVENTVLQNRRVNVQLIADAVGISTGSVKTILCEHVLMRKVCARWVLQMLDQKMKDCRCELSSEAHAVGLEFVCEAHCNR